MKTSKFFLAVGLTVGLCMSLSAQVTVNSSQVEISKPLSVKHIKTTGSLQLDLGQTAGFLTVRKW